MATAGVSKPMAPGLANHSGDRVIAIYPDDGGTPTTSQPRRAMTVLTMNPQNQSLLLNLPAEIRTLIYTFIFLDPDNYVTYTFNDRGSSSPRRQAFRLENKYPSSSVCVSIRRAPPEYTNILLTCHLIYLESIATYHSNTHIKLDIEHLHHHTKSTLTHLPNHHTHTHARRLTITGYPLEANIHQFTNLKHLTIEPCEQTKVSFWQANDGMTEFINDDIVLARIVSTYSSELSSKLQDIASATDATVLLQWKLIVFGNAPGYTRVCEIGRSYVEVDVNAEKVLRRWGTRVFV